MDPNQPTPKLPIRLQRAIDDNSGLRLSRAEARNVARLVELAVALDSLVLYLDRDLSEQEYGEGKLLKERVCRLLRHHKRATGCGS